MGDVKWSECVTPAIRKTGDSTPGLLYDTMGYEVYLPCLLNEHQLLKWILKFVKNELWNHVGLYTTCLWHKYDIFC
jgi:hypothetical protein